VEKRDKTEPSPLEQRVFCFQACNVRGMKLALAPTIGSTHFFSESYLDHIVALR
jgi:hypothetical protein